MVVLSADRLVAVYGPQDLGLDMQRDTRKNRERQRERERDSHTLLLLKPDGSFAETLQRKELSAGL